MTWIRGRLWDGFWMLSGLPIGLALAVGHVPMHVLFAVFLALNSGHLLAPVAMAWSHDGFRQIMLARKVKYILVPTGIIVLGGVFGATVGKTFPVNPITLSVGVNDWADYARPLIALLPLYFVWNAYHFGMQNYGFLHLYRPGGDRTAAMQWAMFATLFGLIIIPELFHQPWLSLFCFGLVIVNHQLAAIGLASHVWANYWGRSPLWFAGALIAFGSGLAWLMLHAAAQAAMTIVGLRVTAGFAHFLYDRWVYKLSDPQVRATIGRDILCVGAAQSQ
jgi:hypothetical protein